MKFLKTIFMLSLSIIFIIIYSNHKVLTKKITHKSDKDLNSIINLRQDKHSITKKHLMTKENRKQSKLKLSAQLVEAKKICWSGQHISERIIDGTKASKDTLPWMVAIYKVSKKREWFHCGGSIISAKFVLSAAYCFGGKSSKPADYVLYYGIHDLTSKNYVKGTIVEIHVYPKYKPGFNDIALIRLKHEVKYNDLISPICVPGLTTPAFWDNWPQGDTVLVSGWGIYDGSANSSEEASKVLRKGIGHLVDISNCTTHLSSGSDFDPRTNLCIGTTPMGNNVCNGDWGSPVIPLVIPEEEGQGFVFPVVIGVVAFGQMYCSVPSLLTKVDSFISWINNVTSKLSY